MRTGPGRRQTGKERIAVEYDLTEGSITKRLLRFAFPLMLGNLLQQFYNVADTWIVGVSLARTLWRPWAPPTPSWCF